MFKKWEDEFLWWIGAASGLMALGSLVAIPFFISRIPADYFLAPKDENPPNRPYLAIISALFKNLLGIIFVLAGLAMLVLPGQGLITLIIGLMLMNFPGKKTLLLRIFQRPTVLSTVNAIRAKTKQPPLTMPDIPKPVTEEPRKTA